MSPIYYTPIALTVISLNLIHASETETAYFPPYQYMPMMQPENEQLKKHEAEMMREQSQDRIQQTEEDVDETPTDPIDDLDQAAEEEIVEEAEVVELEQDAEETPKHWWKFW